MPFIFRKWGLHKKDNEGPLPYEDQTDDGEVHLKDAGEPK